MYKSISRRGIEPEPPPFEYGHDKDVNSEIGKWWRHTFGYLFLHAEEILDCFVCDFISDCPINDSLIKYSNHLVDNYIGNNCNYSPSP